MTKGIYCYVDKKNNEIVYVGQDSKIHEDKRHKDHFYPSLYDKQQINRVLQNNPDRYTYQVLNFDVEDEDTLNALEIQYVRQLKPIFNFTEGGEGASGYKWTDEQKRKKSESMKGENHPMYGLSGEAHPAYGRKHTEEECRKISEKKKGKPLSDEHKRKISKTKSKQRNTTGFYRVNICSCPLCKKGFYWSYQYRVNSQRKSISSTDLNKLKEKVEAKGLPWEILDEKKAKQSLKKDNEDAIK